MALIARAVTPNAASPAASSRAPHSMSTVASASRSQLDGLSSSGGVAFDQSTFLLPDDLGRDVLSKRREQQQEQLPQRRRGAVPTTTTNETFSALFHLTEFKGTEVEEKPYVKGPKGFGGLLIKAIGTYEHNDKLIHGQIVPRGRQLRVAV